MKRKLFLFTLSVSTIMLISGCTSIERKPARTPKIFVDQGPAINANYPQYYTSIPQTVQAKPSSQNKKHTYYTPNLHLSTGIGLGRGGIRFGGIGLGTGLNIW